MDSSRRKVSKGQGQIVDGLTYQAKEVPFHSRF